MQAGEISNVKYLKLAITIMLTKFLHDMQTEMALIPISHIKSRISFRLSDITVVKPE